MVRFVKRGSSLGCAAGSIVRSVLMAVSTKTWSFQTMGVALPRPVSGAFHLMFDVSSQVIGGFALGAVPSAAGPRH